MCSPEVCKRPTVGSIRFSSKRIVGKEIVTPGIKSYAKEQTPVYLVTRNCPNVS